MRIEGLTGPALVGDGTDVPPRLGRTAEVVVTELHGRYYEQTYRGNIFNAANQAAQAVSVALATTYTGLVLSNPAGSRVNLVPLKVGFALSVAPAAIAPIMLISGFATTGITVHTTALTPGSSVIGSPRGTGLADSAATLVGTPAWLMPLLGGFTAAALPNAPGVLVDLEGSIILPPGGYLAIGALTAVTGFGAMIWEEVPV